MMLKHTKKVLLNAVASTCLASALISTAMADNAPTPAELERFHSAQLVYLQTQIETLYDSVELLKQRVLTDQEKFEQIGQPSFMAVDRALGESGFTVKTWHHFADQHQQAIEQWQHANPDHQPFVDELTADREQLMQTYDQLIKRTAN